MNQDLKDALDQDDDGIKRVRKPGTHMMMAVIGMAWPRKGEFFDIETAPSDSDTFQAFLDASDKSIDLQRAKSILIVDNTSWHNNKMMDWQGWEFLYLPPYSPDFNPIERI